MFIQTKLIKMAQNTFECANSKKAISLQRVQANIHTGAYHCLFCEKTFNTNSKLFYHIQAHINEKPYFCNLCDSTFTGTYQLKRHIKSHTGENPFHAIFAKRCSLGKVVSRRTIFCTQELNYLNVIIARQHLLEEIL